MSMISIANAFRFISLVGISQSPSFYLFLSFLASKFSNVKRVCQFWLHDVFQFNSFHFYCIQHNPSHQLIHHHGLIVGLMASGLAFSLSANNDLYKTQENTFNPLLKTIRNGPKTPHDLASDFQELHLMPFFLTFSQRGLIEVLQIYQTLSWTSVFAWFVSSTWNIFPRFG